MTVSTARPDYAAHQRAVRASFPEVASMLREILGAKLCAYLGSVKETRAVNEWADGHGSRALGLNSGSASRCRSRWRSPMRTVRMWRKPGFKV